MDTYSLEFHVLITVFVAALVILLPWADRRICRRLKVNLEGGLSENPDADRILRLRKRLLSAGVVFYLLLLAWLVFFSRSSSEDYTVHVAPLEDLKNAFSTPDGFYGWFRTLFRDGISAALSQIYIARPRDISQFFLNVMVFIPAGYLFPYVFSWFRARVRVRPVAFSFLLSLLIENIQLMTRRGTYDFDDIISNTLGGLIGQLLYIAVGYVVTHPQWRRDLREYRRWKHQARHKTLFPYTKKTGMFRTTLKGSDPAAVCEFYTLRLGFRLRQQLDRRESGETVYLFEMGKYQVQVICSTLEAPPDRQYLTLCTTRLSAVRKRLEMNGIQPGDYRRDPCTGIRMLRFTGPDNVRVEIMEAE